MQNKVDMHFDTDIEYTEIIEASYEDQGNFGAFSNLPDFYRVLFKTSYKEGSLIYTELWMPKAWNGIYIGLGNGGMAGEINQGEFPQYIQKGYAVSQTDMGTSGGRNRGIQNPEVWKDFGWRATHAMTEGSKKLICALYGKSPEYSYFIGGSTGGQQALSEAQRFGEDYDGILAGVPANNRVFLHTYFLWNHNHLRTPSGEVMFSDEEIARITASATDYFQSLGDGMKGDNFITFPWQDENTVEGFIGYLREACPDFSEAQLQALEAVYRGPQNPVTKKQIYNGMPLGSEIYGCGIKECQGEESPHFYPFIWTFGEDYDGYRFDFDRDLEKVSKTLSGDLDANSADLHAFQKNGGKLIAYSGSADPCVPFPDAVAYMERVMDTMGGYNETAAFIRYFLFPGKDHGCDGLGANRHWGDENGTLELLDVLRLWREKGQAPEFLVAAREENGQVKFARKIYPYGSEENPKRPHMKTCEVLTVN